jgi:NAD(P)-dependent dehydrogenase (short-subunit alcohol dehydrogenase family)
MSTPIPTGRDALETAQDRGEAGGPAGLKVCIVGASGKLGRYMVQHALDRGSEVVAVCREVSVDKLEEFSGRITIIPGATDDRQVIERAVAGCDGVLTVLVPRGVSHYASGTAQAVLDHARPGPAWCSRVGTTSRAMARTCTRGRSRHS